MSVTMLSHRRSTNCEDHFHFYSLSAVHIHDLYHMHTHLKLYKSVSQSCAVAETSDGPLDNQTWQTDWKTVSFAIVQLCEYENQTLETFAVASRLHRKVRCTFKPLRMIVRVLVKNCRGNTLQVFEL